MDIDDAWIAVVLRLVVRCHPASVWHNPCFTQLCQQPCVDVVVVDPPWRYRGYPHRKSRHAQYPTVSVPDLCQLPVHTWCRRPAALLLWVTGPHLPQIPRVCRAW